MSESTTNTPTNVAAPVSPATHNMSVKDNPGTSTTMTTAELMPQREGVLASAVDATGSPVWEITDATRVTVRGIQMPVSAAVRNGFLVKDAETGKYREPNEAEQKAQQEHTPQSEPEQVRLPSDVDEGNLDQIVRATQASGIDPLTLVTDFIADPSRPPKGLTEVSRRYGTNHGELVKAWAGVASAAYYQAHETVSKMGLKSDDVFAWAEATNNSLIQSAILRHYGGSLAGYRAIAKAYMEAKGLGGGNKDGVTVLSTKNGVVRVRLPGGKTAELTVKNAKRLGYVR